ncbi:MAG: TetR/AcrR family transcriptional regulator [Alcanivoracaceae bacterium]
MTNDLQDRPYGGESLSERETCRKEKLLQAALNIIGTRGVRAATVRALCGEAGLSPRYYYEAFESTEDLFVQLYQAQTARLASAVLEAIRPAAGNIKLMAKAGLTAFFTELEADPRLTRILFIEYTTIAPRVNPVNQQSFDHFLDLILQLAKPFYEGRLPENINDRILGMAVTGAVVQTANAWFLSGFDHPVETLVENILFLLTSLFRELSIPLDE